MKDLAKRAGLPVAVVGVPPIAPVPAFSVSPGGNIPPLTVQLLYGTEPPAAVSVAE